MLSDRRFSLHANKRRPKADDLPTSSQINQYNKTKTTTLTKMIQSRSLLLLLGMLAATSFQAEAFAPDNAKARQLRTRDVSSRQLTADDDGNDDDGTGDDGWSDPMQNASYNAGPAYVASNTCSYCTDNGVVSNEEDLDGCCPDGGCGDCTNDYWSTQTNINGFMAGIEQICVPTFDIDDISVGHGMYDGHACGECVCIKCDPTNSEGGCKSEEPFLHMRQDNPWGSSNEVSEKYMSSDSDEARWYTNGEQSKTWYLYKKVDTCDPTLC